MNSKTTHPKTKSPH